MAMRALWLLCVLGPASASCSANPVPAGPAPLALERSIPLPDVGGRIDHLAYDPDGQRLFVAELGNGTVDAIRLGDGERLRLAVFHSPQGVAWLQRAHELAVASADGTMKFFRGDRLTPVASLTLGKDADDLRVDPQSGDLIAGYGSGALAKIDPATHRVLGLLPLPAHPEGFQVDADAAFINVPDAGLVIAANRKSGRITARWGTGLRRLNFPMAIDRTAKLLAIGFRFPSTLLLMDERSGAIRQALRTCGDTDDIDFDDKRARLYVICGSGKIDVFRRSAEGYSHEATIATRQGARTGLFDPQIDRLFVAAPARGQDGAAVLIYRPAAS
jgi:hypothetical protein